MKIIAIDLSYKKPLTYCVLSEKGKLIQIGSIEAQNDIYHTANAVLDKIIPFGKSLIITETPLIIHNMNTAFFMVRLHAMLEMGHRNSGSLFFGIHPMTWQKVMLSPEKGDDRKKLSIAEADKWLTALGLPVTVGKGRDDEADAINMARFAFDNKKHIMEAISGGKRFSEK